MDMSLIELLLKKRNMRTVIKRLEKVVVLALQ